MAVPSKQEAPKSAAKNSSYQLLVFSANDASQLQDATKKVQTYTEKNPARLPDVSFTLESQKNHGRQRAFAVTDGSSPLEASALVERQSRPAVNFVFTGQGAQWPRMGAELFENYTSFQEDIKEMDRVLQTLPHPPLWTIEGEILS